MYSILPRLSKYIFNETTKYNIPDVASSVIKTLEYVVMYILFQRREGEEENNRKGGKEIVVKERDTCGNKGILLVIAIVCKLIAVIFSQSIKC